MNATLSTAKEPPSREKKSDNIGDQQTKTNEELARSLSPSLPPSLPPPPLSLPPPVSLRLKRHRHLRPKRPNKKNLKNRTGKTIRVTHNQKPFTWLIQILYQRRLIASYFYVNIYCGFYHANSISHRVRCRAMRCDSSAYPVHPIHPIHPIDLIDPIPSVSLVHLVWSDVMWSSHSADFIWRNWAGGRGRERGERVAGRSSLSSIHASSSFIQQMPINQLWSRFGPFRSALMANAFQLRYLTPIKQVSSPTNKSRRMNG